MSDRKRILIVGGVAGGASCAARARRLSEAADIVIFDRGPYVSFANCGLPYYVGDVIKKEENLLIATPELFRKRFNIDVRLESEVTHIDRQARRIGVRDLKSGDAYEETYDALVLSPGATPIRPPWPGIDLPGIFTLRTIPDSRRIREWIDGRKARRAAVIGGGYIGLEMTENLVKRGLQVTIVEKQSQILPLFDAEMVADLYDSLKNQGVEVRLNDGVMRIEKGQGHVLRLILESGQALETDLVLLSIGVRPETALAREAGLTIGASGGIRVDLRMRTDDPHIWAVGDAVEVSDVVTGLHGAVPLAGPANRQGRIAADAILGRQRDFRGVQGSSVVALFDRVAAGTGPSEKTLRRIGMWERMEKIYLHPGHHAGYYPGAQPITLKLIFEKESGRVIGAQAVGRDGVEKRIDLIAMAIQMGATVFDLEEAELCYAPPFGSAKDPVNLAGMIAANLIRGDLSQLHWDAVDLARDLIVDVRDPVEYRRGHIEGALNLPLDEIRNRSGELPRDREILVHCFVGQRSYYAARILSQMGFDVKNIGGGYKSCLQYLTVKDRASNQAETNVGR
jgi:NADPH-dependent 2,4-dienoyl-CoA reductase/sulfur reductase-like enzyme/rhodanese-related sulfurtransferase